MPLSPRWKFALGAGSIALVAGGAAWAISVLTDDRKKPLDRAKVGSLLCPAQAGKKPAPAASLDRGDFVVVQLQSADKKFSEATWAAVIDAQGDDVVAIISGEQISEGVRPIATDKHGFRLGHRLVLPRECIWEVFRPSENLGQILCGPAILELAAFVGDETLFPVAAGLAVEKGDRVEVIVADKQSFGNTWHEPLWARVINISSTGQVLTAQVDVDPKQSERHGLHRGSILRFNRDCVISVE